MQRRAASTQEGDGIVRDLAALDDVVGAAQGGARHRLQRPDDRHAPRCAPTSSASGWRPVRRLAGTSRSANVEEPIQQLDWPTVRERLAPVLADPTIEKWAHNAKFHQIVLARHGVETEGLAFDSMIAAYLLESNQRAFALRDLAWSKLQIEMPAGSTLLGTGRSATTMDRLSIERSAQYARNEAAIVCRLVPMLDKELKDAGLESLFRDVELPLVPVLATWRRTASRSTCRTSRR